jgi:hypothetical protein
MADVVDPKTTVDIPAALFDRIIGALAAATYPNNPDRDRDNAHNLWTELLALRSDGDKPKSQQPAYAVEDIEAIERDAHRYRWLREHAGTDKTNPLIFLVEDELDRFVDAELEAARAGR